jgi:DNA-binding Lrp family transcriptional regulator
MKAYILTKVHKGEINEVVRQLRKLKNVKEANMTFGPFDVVALVDAKDVNELGSLLASEIQPIPGIEETLTCIAVGE